MDDLISRQAAIEAIRGCTEYYHNNMPTMIDKASAQTELMMLPAADVVEVVRCKDCRYWNNKTDLTYCEKKLWLGTDADDFCSYGERVDS